MPQAENNDLQRRAGGIFAVAVSKALPGTEPVRTLDGPSGSEPVRTLEVAGREPGTPWGHPW
jgi:hypothetical protein